MGLGYGVVFGDMVKNAAMGDVVSGQIPIALGMGYRMTPPFSFGLAFQYAPLLMKDCGSGASCSGHDTRLGVELRGHVAPQEPFSLSISAGVGYEWLSLSGSDSSESVDISLKGVDFDFGVSGDFRVNPSLTLGPFVDLRAGNYGSGSSSVSGSSSSGDIPSGSQGTHGWLSFGIRGTFTP